MTAVVSNLGAGQLFTEVHATDQGDVQATLSTSNITMTWLLGRGDSHRFRSALEQLTRDLTQLDVDGAPAPDPQPGDDR